MKKKVKRSQLQQIAHRFSRNKTAMAGLTILIVFIFLAVFANVLFDYETVALATNAAERLQPPSAQHWFGTDELGRDILARVVHGTKMSFLIGFASVLIGLVGGMILGAVVGYYGGVVDMVVMRIVEIFMAIPAMLMAMIIVSVFGASPVSLSLSLGVALIPAFTRVTRGTVITVCEMEYIESARAIGATDAIIILHHIIPNCFAPLLIQVTLSLASSILSISGLSYLGMGINPPTPEWGSMLSAARNYLHGNGYMAIFPGLAIMLTILALNLIGDGLRDAADPKLKR